MICFHRHCEDALADEATQECRQMTPGLLRRTLLAMTAQKTNKLK